MMTARLSGRGEAGAGWLFCVEREASDLSAEACPAFGALWLSRTSALYTVEDQLHKGQLEVIVPLCVASQLCFCKFCHIMNPNISIFYLFASKMSMWFILGQCMFCLADQQKVLNPHKRSRAQQMF